MYDKERNNENSRKRNVFLASLEKHREEAMCSEMPSRLEDDHPVTIFMRNVRRSSGLRVHAAGAEAGDQGGESEDELGESDADELKQGEQDQEDDTCGVVCQHEERLAVRISDPNKGFVAPPKTVLSKYIYINDLIIMNCRDDVYGGLQQNRATECLQENLENLQREGEALELSSRYFWVAKLVGIEGVDDGKDEAVLVHFYGDPKLPEAGCLCAYKPLLRDWREGDPATARGKKQKYIERYKLDEWYYDFSCSTSNVCILL